MAKAVFKSLTTPGMASFELIHKVLAQGMAQIAACSGSDEPGFMAVGTHPDTGEMYAVSNNEGIGWGATPHHDGANALQAGRWHHLAMTAVRNTSMEVLEHRSPIFHERLELRQNSGGAGRWRGGPHLGENRFQPGHLLGVCRQVKFLATGEVLSMKKKTKTKPWALRGGHEPETNAMIVRQAVARDRLGSSGADGAIHHAPRRPVPQLLGGWGRLG